MVGWLSARKAYSPGSFVPPALFGRWLSVYRDDFTRYHSSGKRIRILSYSTRRASEK